MLYILYLTLGQKSWRYVIWSSRHFANYFKKKTHLALLTLILCFIIKRLRLHTYDGLLTSSHQGPILSKKFPTNLWIFVISSSVFPGKPFQPFLMLVGEARSLSQSGAPERCFTWEGSGLTRQHQTRLERLARENTRAYYENP